MKHTIKKFGVISAGKMLAAILAVMMFVVGLITGVISITQGQILTGVIIILLAPIIYAVIGFITGVLWAFVYNIVAKKIGGLQVEIEQKM